MTRRKFVRTAAVATAAALMASKGVFAQGKGEGRPNILFAIADDWSFGQAGVYGDRAVKTPNFDRVAREGVLFTNSYCIAPTCSPSRAGILTGQPPHRLEEGANLWGHLPAKFPVYPDLLEKAGYRVGFTGKGWGPGQLGDRKRNAAGPGFKGFGEFLKTVGGDGPFCYWFGSHDPHRPYEPALTAAAGIRREEVTVPPYLPDTPEVRDDIVAYLAEVQRFDAQLGNLLKLLEESGRAENTMVVVTSDNGMPFPRAKTNLHDSGTRMPLAIRWPGKIASGKKIDALVSHLDFAPTFLEAVELKPTTVMAGKSLLPLFGGDAKGRDRVFLERERHAEARAGNVGYPCRAVRTREHLYIRNFHPERWPAGDPDLEKSQGTFSDIDRGPAKEFLLAHRDDPKIAAYFQMACAKRPAEELYEMADDPWQMRNRIDDPKLEAVKREVRASLDNWMKETADPRASGDTDAYDKYPYYGAGPQRP
ncbi:MAG TPA: sulfatase [Tepidisphaeraceae bacterium]|jgi:arylsulfatase A-like enzyme|nr:sulfatase [Tepidisphaeraceae bacterium]